MQHRYASLYDRLVANTRVDDDGCWIWTGSTNDGRYPVFTERQPGKAHPVKRYAHRAMLEEVLGYEFPFDEAGHYRCFKPLCIKPLCIKPGCLRVETRAENLATRRVLPAAEAGCWIPTLFPTARRQVLEAIDAHLDWCDKHPGPLAGDPPF
jgi:hypothetical protein